jgi:peroxiredoxin
MIMDLTLKVTLAVSLLSLAGTAFSQIKDVPEFSKGDLAPEFRGKDQYGKWIDSGKLAGKGPVILIFYRGNWCPYCRKHLINLQDSLQMILNLGCSVVVVTPEAPGSIQKMVTKTGATFSILHDQDYKIMQEYGVSFHISELTVPRYLNGVLKNTREANQNEDDILPVPATFILDRDHRVYAVHYDPDYRNRMPVSEILKNLKEMKSIRTSSY